VSRVLYFDCFSGISGDMAIGALIDAGLPVDELTRALGSLALGDAHIHVGRVLRAGVSATKFTVHQGAHHPQVQGAEVHGAQVHQAEVQGAEVHDAEVHGAEVHGAEVHGAEVHGAEVQGAGEHGAHAHHAHRTLAEIFALIDQIGRASCRERV